jgi:glycerol-3-phosphate dehydrogenase (NAD(P)+)
MSPGTGRVAVIGTTAWGTTLGLVLARKGIEGKLWSRTEEEAATLNPEGENAKRAPGFKFPQGLEATASLDEALGTAELVVVAVPSQYVRSHARLIREHLDASKFVLSVTKGLEPDSAKRMSEVIGEEIGERLRHNVCVLSGPNLAREIAEGLPATTVVAAADESVAAKAQTMMASPVFRVYVNTDVVGVELGGVLKNIVALAAGMVDGLGFGDNTKAGLMTRGLAEITRLGAAAGANPLTFAGLAGLGDLVATCSSPLSRNRFVGQELAKGRSPEEIMSSMAGTAEGVTATSAALKLADGHGVEMPIARQVYRVLHEGLDVRQGIAELMGRELKHEYGDIPGSAIERA